MNKQSKSKKITDPNRVTLPPPPELKQILADYKPKVVPPEEFHVVLISTTWNTHAIYPKKKFFLIYPRQIRVNSIFRNFAMYDCGQSYIVKYAREFLRNYKPKQMPGDNDIDVELVGSRSSKKKSSRK